ncbi:OsmC family protein [Diaphorobacter sp. HDW4A]|uniref:OsmC family protein n=1 Tax=Diaphorobacter sp. HDW4A TaxID=2714924 RepID=UPI00140D71F4|nr:OsmC family protein [Diaphorobacter sp. HDW4A]QIL81552.1 OsmC family protein [Diaphorobacter sp. HDW4A]
MSLNDYLSYKRSAVLARDERIAKGSAEAHTLQAHVTAEGRSGVRRLRIREHQVISDSPYDFAGFNLGPSSPELQLGVLGTCVTHIFEIQAAKLQVPLDRLEVKVQGRIDPRAGHPGHEATPIWPHDIAYEVQVETTASDERLAELFEAVERNCPILNLLRNPQQIAGRVVRTASTSQKKAEQAEVTA